ncbi:Hypothetical Protein FCC1311_022022 [Hondaea fermentalgiana]|uniref:Uncharacterized protein n=1 Tax=Hondaea fermentalgiana TaxID=2315210 RepID=A0A2R5G4M9_9STRA|nr:Hypothetical Protein FCC1311_022022 [Hondaea fermentalgiana]|eukprot:GBG25982.1 Hypothetical Protein FCC1311_022022 [Hondaea fermentalgiana]
MELLDIAFSPSATVRVQLDGRVHELQVTAEDDATALVHELLASCASDIAPGSLLAVDLERSLGRVILGMARSETAFFRSLRRVPGANVVAGPTAIVATKLRIAVDDSNESPSDNIDTAVRFLGARDEESKSDDEDDDGDGDDDDDDDDDDDNQNDSELGGVKDLTNSNKISKVDAYGTDASIFIKENAELEGLGAPLRASSTSPSAIARHKLVSGTSATSSPLGRTVLRKQHRNSFGEGDQSPSSRRRASSKVEENFEAYMAVLEAQSSPRRNNDRETFFQ